MVAVSTEALSMVRNSLSEYLNYVGGISAQVLDRTREIEEECRQQMRAAENDREESELRIAALTKAIKDLEEEIRRIAWLFLRTEFRSAKVRFGQPTAGSAI